MPYQMKKILLVIMIISACTSGQNLESRVKEYMKDSVVVNFNDPKSYEYISMQTDSVFSHKTARENIESSERAISSENLKFLGYKLELGSDTNGLASLERPHNSIVGIYNNSIKKDRIVLSQPDSVLSVNITVKCRAKNAMGALVINDVSLSLENGKLRQN